MDPLTLIEGIKSVTGPLTLIAFLAVIIFAIIREITKGKRLEKLYELLKGRITKERFYALTMRIIDRTFWLTVIVFVGGFLTFIIVSIYPGNAGPQMEDPEILPPTGPTHTPTEQPSETVTEEPTATNPPTLEAQCPILPVAVGTPVPTPLESITQNKVYDLVEYASWRSEEPQSIVYLSFNKDNSILIAGLENGTVALWNVDEGSWIGDFQEHQLVITDLGVSYDESGVHLFATSSRDSSARIWILRSGNTKVKTTLKRDEQAVYAVAFSPDGEIIATGDGGNRVNLWLVSDGTLLDSRTWIDEEIQEVKGYNVSSLDFSKDGALLAATSTDGSVHIWVIAEKDNPLLTPRLQDKREIRPTAPFGLSKIKFSPFESTIVVTASSRGPVLFWSVETGELLRSVKPQDPLTEMAFSSDGQILAGVTEGGIVYLWGYDGRELRVLEVFERGRGLAFSPDGLFLALGNDLGLSLWAVDPCLR